MSEVRLLFDSVVADYPTMGGNLKSTAKIVYSPAFENGLVKICDGEKLSAAETAALRCFEIIQQGGVKRRQMERAVYSPLAALVPPTLNTCERLFSECKMILTLQRSCMLPAHFEMLMFLRANKDMWDVTSLA
ncbi:hypothetical protein PC114_g15209 [Phytophthora cactorum]|uniref:HAT C-terminal dimerisation domain-containing protein n=2 Tax=Phytophthora cactorum TaxID=29920 RepID=A0A8T1BV79_9STRA|nr:hypothetical protein PC114_g15209 [Phytophthora cactorum]KAG2909283.1 hypothetical protein PC115_g13304 [Phytophthora cactorum]KAG2921951.1 hypothetical protein PC117_g16090 [Phytophthora cactorum]KAG3061728.1 hypothetical protein PC122_g19556 [Phytophthora cactorum]KAG3153545.1 hypothetical protein C6341_g15906 [Phytophthora cactorum]